MDLSPKLTTYGKTSRKLKSDFHRTELDQSACSHPSPIYQDNKAQFEIKAQGQSIPTDFPYSRANAAHSHSDQSQQSLRTLVKSRALVGPHRTVFESSLPSASNSPKKRKKAVTYEEDKVFEVPSSDNEQSIRLKASGSRLKRKRKNRGPGSITDESGSVCEDVGLQRHVAAELRKEQHLSSATPEKAKLKIPTTNPATQEISRGWVHEQDSGDIEVAEQHRLSWVLGMPSALDQAAADHIVPNSNLTTVPTRIYPMNQRSRFSNHEN